jgi:pimeloyl-ACP methyl ester carboxylesterase
LTTTTSTTIVSNDGTPIVVDRAGSGPAVVLIGGGPTNRSAASGLADILSEQLTVFNYDRRGRGDSGDTPPYSIEREFEDLAAVLALADGPVAVYGTSAGAIWGLEAAARQLPITRLVCWEPPYFADGSPIPPPTDYASKLAALLADGRRSDALDLFFIDAAGLPAAFLDGMHQAPFWTQMEADADALGYDAKLIGDFSIPAERLQRVAVPTLIVDGETTPSISYGADAVARIVPGAQRRTLAGQPHNVADDAIAPVIIDFVTSDGTRE